MKFLRRKSLAIHVIIQKKWNLTTQILTNYLISNITNIYHELKGGCMEDQVRLFI